VIYASTCAPRGAQMVMSSVVELRSRPSLSLSHLAVRRFMLVLSPEHKPHG